MTLSFLSLSLKRQADYERPKGVEKSIIYEYDNKNIGNCHSSSFLHIQAG